MEDNNNYSSKNIYNSGDKFGEFLLREKLGKTTFKAVRETDQTIVAIKILHKSLENAQQLYETEIKAFDSIKDIPRVLQLLSNGKINDDYYIVTEFISKETLRDVFQRHSNGMGIDEVLHIFTSIAETIDKIHEHNIIHRDLKPENILLREVNGEYEIFISDFGAVKFVDKSKSYLTEKDYGTLGYIAPEGWTDSIKTTAIDIFSFGIMLYEAFEGRFPFENYPPPAYPVLYPGRTRANVKSDGVVDLLLWTLSERQDERPRTAREVIEILENINLANELENKWIGRKFKQYIVDKVLAKGKSSPALRAIDIRSGNIVVLKAFEQDQMKVYEEELKSIRKLQHGNNVLTPKDAFEESGFFFIVTDYQSGGNLREILNKKSRLDIVEFKEIFMPVAKAIDYFHRNGIVHRDIKPENIVYSDVDGKKNPYITDFGIARVLDGTKSSFYTKTISGTFPYMAPETWNINGKQTKAVDIYAFGVCCYEALEGHLPFEAKSHEKIMRQHLDSPVPPLKYTVKTIGSKAGETIIKALSKKPNDRPKSAVKIVNEILDSKVIYKNKKKSDGKTRPTEKGIITDKLIKPGSRKRLFSFLMIGLLIVSAYFLFKDPILDVFAKPVLSSPTNTLSFSPTTTITNTNTSISETTGFPTTVLPYAPFTAKITQDSNCRYYSFPSPILEKIPAGEYVTVEGKNENGDWFFVAWMTSFRKEIKCWIAKSSITLTNAQVTLMPVIDPPPTFTPTLLYSSTPNDGGGNTNIAPIITTPPPIIITTKPPPIIITTKPPPTDTNTPSSKTECKDDIDNDGDGFIDSQDPQCKNLGDDDESK